MSASNQAPFARLVEYFKGAFQSADQISIPAQILAAFHNSAQPLDDTGLRDFVKLFDTSRPCSRFRLDSSVFSQLVRIIFELQPSLLQLKLIYFLLVPPKATYLDAFKIWRSSVSEKLILAILGLLQEGALGETLLIGAADSLALFIDGDEEAKRTVYSAEDELRHALGTIISKHDSYVLKIAVANLVREFMTGRFGRHLFRPDAIAALSFNNFPLAQAGNAEWLASAVEFISAVNTSKAFRADPPEIHFVQYAGIEHSAAIISEDVTLVLPAISQHPLRFLRLPLIEGMVCLSSESPHNDVVIRYRRTTGYQVYQGVKRAAEEVRLILGDHAQSIAFANSVQSKVAGSLADTSLAPEPKLAYTRASYASIDLSQSRDTSVESQDQTSHFAHASEPAVSVTLPGYIENQGVADSQLKQEHATERSRHVPQAQISPFPRISAADPPRKILSDLQPRPKKKPREGSIAQNSAMPSAGGDGVAKESMTDKRHGLKRPTVKGAATPNGNDIDWDEDLRSDENERAAPAAKRVKTTSKKVEKSKSSTTRRTSSSKSKRGSKHEKTSNSKAKTSGKTAATTRTRRSAVMKSTKYVEWSDSDIDDNYHQQSSSVAEDVSHLAKENGLWKKDNIRVTDSQGAKSCDDLNSHELNSIKSLPAEESTSATLTSAAKLKNPVQDEEARGSHPMNTAITEEALTQSDASFGVKIAQTLTAKAHLLVAAIDQPSRKSFGDVKKFVQTVNVAKSSPQKSSAKELQGVQPDRRKAAIHRSSLNDQRLANSTVQNSLPQVQSLMSIKSRPQTHVAPQGLAEGNQRSDNVHLAHEKAPTTLPMEDIELTVSISVQNDDLEQAVLEKAWKDDLDLATVAVKQATHQTTGTTITTTGDRGEENPVKSSNISDGSPEIGLPKSPSTASARSLTKQESRKMLQEIHESAEAEKSMDPPPLPPRFERRSIPSPSNITVDPGQDSLPLTNERTQRKTPIVSFSTQGPRNQGVLSPSKKPNVTDVSVPVPAETGKHGAVKRSKKQMPFEPVRLAALVATNEEVSGQSSEAVNEGDGIFVQEESPFDSLATVPSFGIPDREGILAEDESAVEADATSGSTLRGNASQTSRVDENGSPRLHTPRLSQKARGVSEKNPTACPPAVHPEVDGVPPSPSLQQLLSDANTRVLRLGPKKALDNSKAAREASQAATSFTTSFKNMPMLPPPLSLPRQGQTDLRAALVGESKRKSGPTPENEDLTLINDEDSGEHGHVQSTTLRQRQQSPNFSAYSQSPPIPDHVQLSQDSRKENQEPHPSKIRFTQQHILNILSRVASDVLFRLQIAEQAIQGKTQEYHSGCCTLIDRLETTYEAYVQHERSRAAPRVAELYESYNKTIKHTSQGIRRVRGSIELDSLSEKIEKRRNYLLSIIGSQMKKIEWAE